MKRFFTSLLLGLVIALVIDRAVGGLLVRVFAESQFRLSAIYSHRIQPEILIAGNSRAMQSLNAERLGALLGKSVFNIGFNGLSDRQVCALVTDAIEHHPNIRKVLLEVSCFNLQYNREETVELRPLVPLSRRIEAIYENRTAFERSLTHISRLYDLDAEIFLRALRFEFHDDQSYVSETIMPPEMIDAPVGDAVYAGSTPPEALKQLSDLKAVLAAHQCELIPVMAPYHPSLFRDRGHYDAVIREIASEVGRPVIDLGFLINRDTSFADRLHTNKAGAEAVAQALLETHQL